MAADVMAIAGMPPVQAAQPVATGSPVGAPEGGEVFADVMATAMSASPTMAVLATEIPVGELGIDAPGLLGALAGTPEGAADLDVPTVMGDGSRLDRDAEAEGLQGALASMLFGVLMRPTLSPPLQAMPGLAAPAATVATPMASEGSMVMEAAVVAAAQAEGSARVVSSDAVDVSVMPAEGQVAAAVNPASVEPLADAPMAYAAPALAGATAPVGTLDAAESPVRDESGGKARRDAAAVSAMPGEALVSLVNDGSTSMPSDDDAPVAPAVHGTKSESTTASAAPALVPEQPPTELARDGSTVIRTIGLAEAAPAERRSEDGVATVAGTDGSRPAPPVATPPAAASAALAATDGQSLASAVADSVQLATLRGDRELTLALNPPDLGHLTVQITEDASGAMTIAIHASSTEAHDLLQQHLPALRAGLEQRDVRVEQLQVDQQAPSSGLDWTSGGGRESSRRRDGGDDGQPQWSPLAALRRGADAASGATTSTRSSAVDVRA